MARGDSKTETELGDTTPAVPPPGIRIEERASGSVRVEVRIGAAYRALLSLPRVFCVLLAAGLLIEAWRHRVFVAFWFVGLPFLRWLRGPGPSSLAIGERELVVSGTRAFGGLRSFARASIARVEPGRAGPLQLFQPALLIHGNDGHTTPICVGLSRAQAVFLSQGFERWLENHD